MRANKNFMQMTDEEFAQFGLTGSRLVLANVLRSRLYDYI